MAFNDKEILVQTMYMRLSEKGSAMRQFKIHEIPVIMAVDVGLVNQEFRDAERERLGPLYPMYYECDFYNSSSTWYRPECFQYGDYGEDM